MQHIFSAVREYERLFGMMKEDSLINDPLKTPVRPPRPPWMTPQVLPLPDYLAQQDLEDKVKAFFLKGKPNDIVGSILSSMDPQSFILAPAVDLETSWMLFIVYFYSIVNTIGINEITMVPSLNEAMREYKAPQYLLDEADFYIKNWEQLTERFPDEIPSRDKAPHWSAIRKSIEENRQSLIVSELVTQIMALRRACPRLRRFDQLTRWLSARSTDFHTHSTL